jgi:hypothetical protein
MVRREKMRSKIFTLCMTSGLLLFGLNGSANSQPSGLSARLEGDSIDIAIEYTSAYPGSETWIKVMMKNPTTSVSGYSFDLRIGNPGLARFCQDDTGGCLVDDGGTSHGCECLNEDCTSIRTTWSDSIYIEPSPNYQTLFKICASACCIPDSTNDRYASLYLDPGGTSFVYDTNGQPVPFRFHQSELLVWWSVPGDANGDSLVNSGDLVFLINYLYRFWGILPCVCEAADCTSDCIINSSDIVYLIGYLYRSGPPPVPGCARCPHEHCRS